MQKTVSTAAAYAATNLVEADALLATATDLLVVLHAVLSGADGDSLTGKTQALATLAGDVIDKVGAARNALESRNV